MKQSIIVPGEPVAQGRPRFTTINGYPRAYDPDRSSAYKDLIRIYARVNKYEKGAAVSLTVRVFKSIPKSWSNKMRDTALRGELYPTSRPDTDNYIKIVMDALNGFAWYDDSQVVQIVAQKRYANEPRIEIEVEAI